MQLHSCDVKHLRRERRIRNLDVHIDRRKSDEDVAEHIIAGVRIQHIRATHAVPRRRHSTK